MEDANPSLNINKRKLFYQKTSFSNDWNNSGLNGTCPAVAARATTNATDFGELYDQADARRS